MDNAYAERPCQACRQKRVKCDKRLTGCQRCADSGLQCPGYKTARKFLDESEKVRKKFVKRDEHNNIGLQSPALSALSPEPGPLVTPHADYRAHSRPGSGLSLPSRSPPLGVHHQPGASLLSLGSYQRRPSPGFQAPASTSVNVAPLISGLAQTFPSGTPLSDARATPEYQEHARVAEIVAPSTVAYSETTLSDSIDYSNSDFFDLDIETYYANGNNACGFIPGVPVILSEVDDLDLDNMDHHSLAPTAPDPIVASQGYTSGQENAEAIAERKQEMALLIRLFVDFMAPWMDLFDFDAYFTRIIPLKAATNAMLQSALAAVASKQLARYGMNSHIDHSRYAAILTSKYRGVSAHEWFYKAASYYDRGISCLRTFLRRYSHGGDPSFLLSPPSSTTGGSPEGPQAMMRQLSRRSSIGGVSADSDLQDLLSAISVFSLYESFDDSTLGVSQHLNGFQSLVQGRRVSPSTSLSVFASRTGGRAAFWNFALEDLLSAYANGKPTRLHPIDLDLWVSAGLPLVRRPTDPAGEGAGQLSLQLDAIFDAGRDDVIACTLIWIANRVVNFIVERGAQTIGGIHLRHWTELRNLLEVWHKRLPVTFHPYATVETRNITESRQGQQNKMFFSVPMSAGALQLYHFVQILLILHRPSDTEGSQTQGTRLRALRNAAEESEHHSRHICGIALGSPPSAVQRLMIQPLHLAGSCFEGNDDRRLVQELLENVEVETGSSTLRVRQDLLSQWGWPGGNG
ncbi:uncharacterized protein HMPREF1541_10465 [Cyphellophora europaea CBS 101466]|uniref:Zn(2)-C6 fungal-type domain-containing protein n=1 Tax=Cyphellophora europaea (strain CBS 101466) TaxID=1220924 RepID=W2S6M8_CYPE1|nr:uncharacterized protein HMPREF1541_10465 [Cyphellophora europaea CBS 101466]ETN44285.1 hypothetical protein HMPREF1541_10465 [Cyphellophora europaea CBS 101466]